MCNLHIWRRHRCRHPGHVPCRSTPLLFLGGSVCGWGSLSGRVRPGRRRDSGLWVLLLLESGNSAAATRQQRLLAAGPLPVFHGRSPCPAGFEVTSSAVTLALVSGSQFFLAFRLGVCSRPGRAQQLHACLVAGLSVFRLKEADRLHASQLPGRRTRTSVPFLTCPLNKVALVAQAVFLTWTAQPHVDDRSYGRCKQQQSDQHRFRFPRVVAACRTAVTAATCPETSPLNRFGVVAGSSMPSSLCPRRCFNHLPQHFLFLVFGEDMSVFFQPRDKERN